LLTKQPKWGGGVPAERVLYLKVAFCLGQLRFPGVWKAGFTFLTFFFNLKKKKRFCTRLLASFAPKSAFFI
jgi:hypothetical protein